MLPGDAVSRAALEAPLHPPATLMFDYPAPQGAYDELFDAARQPRSAWAGLLQAARKAAPAEFQARSELARKISAENGLNFNVFADQPGNQRPWQLDLLPFIVGTQEWSWLSAALVQRAQVLELLIKDLYGAQTLIKSRLLPVESLFAHPDFKRPFVGLHSGSMPSLTLLGMELARSPQGDWRVMADRTASPVGPGFALENRIVSSRCIPTWMQKTPVQRLAPFFIRLQNALTQLAGRGTERPRIVVLASGPGHPHHFEDAYLARYLGYTLVEGGDLAVRDDRLFLKTLAGLIPVDTLLFRGGEEFLDPLELGGYAPCGVPGILQSLRKGHARLGNLPGSLLLESPLFMAFLPGICRHFQGQDLMLPSIPTWWLGDAEARRYVWSRWDQLVIKSAYTPSGNAEFFPSQMSEEGQAALRARIEARPYAFVAQEYIQRSALPYWNGSRLQLGYAAIRTFLVQESGAFHAMPGGLVRIAKTAGPMELSASAGDFSKDFWVLADAPVEKVSLLAPANQPVPLRRTTALFPSRVADNLFWLGRSLERADFLAKGLRSLSERLLTDGDPPLPAIHTLVRMLVEQGQLEAGYAVDSLSGQLPPLESSIIQVLYDTHDGVTLANSLKEMLRLASLARDWLSPETWQVLNQTGTAFLSKQLQSLEPLDSPALLNQLTAGLASATGLVSEGMIRGPAWRFLDIGRRIERGSNLARLAISVLQADHSHDVNVLKAVLELIDCRMTYRTRYLDNLQRNAVLDLCITDDTNPHSVVYQSAAISEHVDSLPSDPSLPLRTAAKRDAMAILHALRMITPEQLSATISRELERILTQVNQRFKELSLSLTRTYLVHSSSPRQWSEITELP